MKKIFLVAITFIGSIGFLQAQEIATNAIGLRLGDSRGLGAEVSYQRAILESNRLEFGLGWRNGNDYDGVKLTAIYQWVWHINGGFNWYAGPGVGFSAYRFDNPGGKDFNDSFVLLSGDVGVEYKFDFPLLVSLDIRPEFGLGSDRYDNNDLDFDVGLGFRYTF